MARKRTARSDHPPPPSPSSPREVRRMYVILAVIILAGIFLRVYALNQESLWLDEGISLYVAKTVSLKGLLSADYLDFSPGHPPVYFILLKFWMILFGSSPVSARLFSAVAGIAALPLMYLFGQRIFNERTALTGTALLSFSFFHIYYSQEARMYSLLFFFAIASMLLLFRILESPSTKNVVLFALVNVLGLYTGYFYVYVVGTHFAVVLLQFLKGDKPYKLGVAVLISILLFIPWTAVAVREFSAGRSTSILFSYIDLGVIAKFFLGIPAPELGYFVSSSFPGAGVLFAAGLLLLLGGILYSLKQESGTLLVFYLVLPILAYKLLEVLFGPMLLFGVEARYLIILLPVFLLVLAHCLSRMENRMGLALTVMIILSSFFCLHSHYTTLLKEDWRGATQYLTTVVSPGDQIVIAPSYLFYPMSLYFPEGWPETMESAPNFVFVGSDFYNVNSTEGITLVKSQEHFRFTDSQSRLTAYINNHYTLKKVKPFSGSGGTRNIVVQSYFNASSQGDNQ